MAGGGAPGILTLLDLLEEHPVAFAYDWRARFGVPATAIGTGVMSWGEAWLLLRGLLDDPSSRVAAAVSGWKYPMSREAMVSADLCDVLVAVNSDPKKSRPKPYPRPWKIRTGTNPLTGTRTQTPEQIAEILRRIGPERPDDEGGDDG